MYKKDLYNLKDLQRKILEIAEYIDKICRMNSIEYYIYGGTALGARRHGGFIPWDDDMDIIMTQKNFDNFIKVFKKECTDKYYLQVFGKDKQNSIFAKLRANGTAFIEEETKDKKIHHGIYVDIFTLQNCPDKSYLRWMQYFWAKYLSAQNYAYTNHRRRNICIEVVLGLLKKLPRFFLADFAMKEIKKYNNLDTKYYSKFVEGCRYKDGFFKKEIMGKPIDITFENLKLMGPENIDRFLEITYENWEEIPKEESIRKSIHATIWDTKKDYAFYLKNCNSLVDEKYL